MSKFEIGEEPMKPGHLIGITTKHSYEIRRDGPDRCRITGCSIPMAKDWDARASNGAKNLPHPLSCGNHECDKPNNLRRQF